MTAIQDAQRAYQQANTTTEFHRLFDVYLSLKGKRAVRDASGGIVTITTT